MPAKLWADFERLTASDLNTYLAQQVASVFANAAARDAAIPAPVTGQPAYLTDTKALTVYDGSVWRELARGFLGAKIASTANQSIPDAAYATLTLPTVVYDFGGFALGSNALTVPAGADGLYEIGAFVSWAGFTGTYRGAAVVLGGVPQIDNDFQTGFTSSVQGKIHLIGTRVLVAGNVVTVQAVQDSAGAQNTAHSADAPLSLWIHRLGPSS